MIRQREESFCFEPDEVFIDKKLDGVKESEFLNIHDGLFKVADVEKVLNLDAGTLRNLALRLKKQGKSPYTTWGIGNSSISHWVVRMRVFSKVWEEDIKPLIRNGTPLAQTIPGKIAPRDLVKLEGVFKLADLKGKFPFSHQSIKNQARKLADRSRSVMGCWKEGSQFYVDMQPFLEWLKNHQYN